MSDGTVFPGPPCATHVLIAHPAYGLGYTWLQSLQDFYDVAHSTTIDETLLKLAETKYDLVILDESLADPVATTTNQIHKRTLAPVIVIGESMGASENVIACLGAGADDCVRDTVHPQELLARVRKTLRRVDHDATNLAVPPVIEHRGVIIDLVKRTVTRDNQVIRLSPNENRILEILSRRPGRLFSKEQILEAIWGNEPKARQYQHLRTYMTRIRKKLGDEVKSPYFISTETGLGYRWIAPTGARNSSNGSNPRDTHLPQEASAAGTAGTNNNSSRSGIA